MVLIHCIPEYDTNIRLEIVLRYCLRLAKMYIIRAEIRIIIVNYSGKVKQGFDNLRITDTIYL